MGKTIISIEESIIAADLQIARDSQDPALLEGLAKHHNNGIVRLVASNPHTPKRVLEELGLHPNHSVREHLCGNPSTPLQTVQDLTLDSDPTVIEGAYHRLGITPFLRMEDEAEASRRWDGSPTC